MLELADDGSGIPADGGGESKAHGEAEAGRLLQEGLRAAGLKLLTCRLGKRGSKSGHCAGDLQNTSVQMGWIAEKLVMKSASNVSQQLRRWAIQARTQAAESLHDGRSSHDS